MHNNIAQKLNFMHENQKQSTKLDKKVTTLKNGKQSTHPINGVFRFKNPFNFVFILFV